MIDSADGDIAQNTTASTSLFGNTTQQQNTQPTSLFGAPAGQQQQQQPQAATASNGLFGGLGASTAQQQQPSGSLFGTVASQPPVPASTGQLAQPSTTGTNAHFQTLLERGKKRREPTASGLEFGELPTLQLGLGDIASKVRNLGGANSFSKAGRAEDTKAYVRDWKMEENVIDILVATTCLQHQAYPVARPFATSTPSTSPLHPPTPHRRLPLLSLIPMFILAICAQSQRKI